LRIECVPNFSSGRDELVIAAIRDAIGAHSRILDSTSDRDHNRSVITFIGSPDEVERAALSAAAVAVEQIDLRLHSGVHPRIGSLDVLPFVPLAGATLADCASLARRVASLLWNQLALPSFFYEAAAGGRGLEDVRRAAAVGAAPDSGVGRHPSAGAVAIGARRLLVAWNIILDSTDLGLAKRIAREIRFSSGGFPGVKALGLPLEERGCVQVSINSTDFEATGLQTVFDAVEAMAARSGVKVEGSELIGMIPRAAFEGAAVRWLNFEPRLIIPER
jgi:glutamate formiminotransferase/glutamate formiminotransferase/formiminotetrahydrofolate cyclodeaminase